MNYDIYHSSITYFPLLPLSKTASFECKVLDIRQMPAQVLFPHWDDEFEFIYVLSGMMEFRVRQKAFLVSSGEGFFLNTGEIEQPDHYPPLPVSTFRQFPPVVQKKSHPLST